MDTDFSLFALLGSLYHCFPLQVQTGEMEEGVTHLHPSASLGQPGWRRGGWHLGRDRVSRWISLVGLGMPSEQRDRRLARGAVARILCKAAEEGMN